MTDTTAKIRAKGLDSTGVTETLATRFADAESGHLVAIVDLRVEEVHKKTDGSGNRRVDFVIDTIEPVVDGKLNGTLVDHVRDIQQALHRNRMLAENGPQLPLDGDGPEPTVKDVLAQGKGLLDDLPDPDDEDEPDTVEEDLDDDSDDGEEDQADDVEQDDEPANADNPAYEPHTFVDGPHALCTYYGCGQPAGKAIHDTEPEDDAA